jgi:hypothetical protein
MSLRRGQRTVRSAGRIGGQQHRTRQERRRRGQPTAGLRPARRPLQLRRGILVGPGHGLGPVPGPVLRRSLRVGGLGQGAVHRLPVRNRRRPVRYRAQQRMPESHPGAELHQARVHRGRRRLNGYAQPPGRPPD